MPDLFIARACSLIEAWVGVQLRGAAPARLGEFLEQRALAIGMASARDYLAHLEALSPSDPEVVQLINFLTNGLTAFWRDTPQLDAIRLAMMQLATKRDARQHPITIWCAGCATGEEAYTLAMLAEESEVPAVVLGTDINSDFLEHARQGGYGEWSLRRLAPQRVEAHFEQKPDAVFSVSGALRARVSFRKHNLLDLAPRSPSPLGWDLIVCRNVLIYFARDVTRRVIGHFGQALQSDGYLMLGSSEQLSSYYASTHRAPFRAARHGAGFVYRLSATPPGATVYNLPLINEVDASHEALFRSASTPAPHQGDEQETQEMDQPSTVVGLVEAGILHLHRHDRESAFACFEAALTYDPFMESAYLMLGLLLRTTARRRAIETLRKVLFINPGHWIASFELARLLEHEGDGVRAMRAYEQVLAGIERGEKLFKSEVVAGFFDDSPEATERLRAASVRGVARLS